MDDLQINALVTRLSRPHPSGGVVIERAAILGNGRKLEIGLALGNTPSPGTALAPVLSLAIRPATLTETVSKFTAASLKGPA